MPDELNPNELRNLWQSQEMEKVTITMDQIRSRSARFERRIRRRNMREYVAAGIVTVFFGAYVWHAHGWRMTPGLLLIAGLVWSMYQVHRRSARSLPADAGFTASLQFHRKELERQRDALRSVLWWYLGPLFPGCAAMTAVTAVDRGFSVRLLIAILVMIAGFVGVWILNVRGARKLERRIQEIKAMEVDN